MKERTKLILDFFIKDLHFEQENVLYFIEDQVERLVKLLDQSKIFKTFPANLESLLRNQAERVFMSKGASNC
jgi:hypothetical protein